MKTARLGNGTKALADRKGRLLRYDAAPVARHRAAVYKDLGYPVKATQFDGWYYLAFQPFTPALTPWNTEGK